MSDEAHMESALFRYADHTALQPWQAPAPDEVLMAKEEPCEEPLRRAWLQELILSFLFADGAPERWENVAMRALAIFRHCLIHQVIGRNMAEVEALRARSEIKHEFTLVHFIRLSQQDDWREILEGIMGYFFPPGRRWLYRGCIRVYLVAKTYQPTLLVRADVEGSARHGLSFQELAKIFEPEKMSMSARARWSARAEVLIRQPIEAAGGRSGLSFSKSASAREKMAASARGNRNRNGGGGEKTHRNESSPEAGTTE